VPATRKRFDHEKKSRTNRRAVVAAFA